jgi:hypothetical protein
MCKALAFVEFNTVPAKKLGELPDMSQSGRISSFNAHVCKIGLNCKKSSEPTSTYRCSDRSIKQISAIAVTKEVNHESEGILALHHIHIW